MKKLTCICMILILMLSVMTGCSAGDSSADAGNAGAPTISGSTAGAPTGKVVINFEGTVAEVNGSEITLGTGKIVVITDETVFAGDPDTGNAVSSDIAVGNFIQGYTADDPEAAEITAAKVYFNKVL